MLEDIPTHVSRRNRQRSIAISDNLINKIKKITEEHLSVSGFIKMAVIKEIRRMEKRNEI
jgi:hypothetical protein